MTVRRNAENRALCPFHGENRGSIPLGRANKSRGLVSCLCLVDGLTAATHGTLPRSIIYLLHDPQNWPELAIIFLNLCERFGIAAHLGKPIS